MFEKIILIYGRIRSITSNLGKEIKNEIFVEKSILIYRLEQLKGTTEYLMNTAGHI